MNRDFVLYEKKEGIAKITVNRPDVLNAITRQVYAEIDDAFTEAEKDNEVRVIVVAGAGRHFGAGHDMGSKQARLEEERNPRDKTPLGFLKDMETRRLFLSARTLAEHSQTDYRHGSRLVHHGQLDVSGGLRPHCRRR